MPALLEQLNAPAPVVFAPTGMVPTRAMTPHVPFTPAEVARDVAAAAGLGITSVHLHARDEDGAPTWDREVYARLVGAVREAAPDVLINVSTSGRNWSELEKRADVLALDEDLKPDLASLTPSSLNFLTSASVNAPDTVRGLLRIMRDRGIAPELEIFDLGMLNVVAVLQKEGLLVGPIIANLFLGNVAGLQASPLDLGIAVERLPAGSIWAGAGLGDYQFIAQTLSLASGGGVRVGIEDGIFLDRSRTVLATNGQLVERTHHQLALLGRTVMTPAQLRSELIAR